MKIMYVRGVEGNSIYLNDYRIVGPKPWGGGQIIQEWDVDPKSIYYAMLHEILNDYGVWENKDYKRLLKALKDFIKSSKKAARK
jgi:hypothetical protein